MNQITSTFFSDEVWKTLESQKSRFDRVGDLERELVDISNPEDFFGVEEPNFILFPTSSVLPIRDSRFQSAHGGVIGYHVASKDRFYILGQYHKPLCVTHLSESLLDPMMSVLDMEKIREIPIQKIPILYSATYEPGLTEFSDRVRVSSINELAIDYINS